MPTSVAKLLALLSRLNQFPQRVALFPLFEEIGDDLFAGSVMPRRLCRRPVGPASQDHRGREYSGVYGLSHRALLRHSRATLTIGVIPRWCGTNWFRQVAGLYERRNPVAIHCNGDAPIDDGLDAIEAAMLAHPWPEARPLIIHAQMTRKDQIDRMAKMGVTPSFSAHTLYWGDRQVSIFMGPERAANMSPARWALRGSGSATFGYAGDPDVALAGSVESDGAKAPAES